MANFQYTALDSKGIQATGTVSAASEAEAIQQLRSQGLYPTQVVAAGAAPAKGAASAKGKGKAKKANAKKAGVIKRKPLMVFTRQLATLIESGLPLLRSLTVLGKQEPDPIVKTTITSLSDSVQGGATFSESLAQHPRTFDRLFVNMVKAGELGGVLDKVLDRLAEYMEKADKLKSKIVSAMIYPAIVMFIAIAILIFLMLVVVPRFKEMFDGESKLPALSRAVFGFSDFMLDNPLFLPNALYLFIIFAIGVIGFRSWASTDKGREKVDRYKLIIPGVGKIQRLSAISRFSRTLGTLVTSGVPILQALGITKDTAGNVVIANAVDKIYAAVKEGESIVAPMQASGVFPPMVVSMVDVGEETGQLPDMLLKVADVYDDEVDSAVGRFTASLEPIMIVFLAVVVGTIVLALFLPMIAMMKEASG